MLLRDYQNDAIDKLRESLRSGKKRPVIQAPTGAGKTVIAAAIIEMARAKGKRVLFCVPALELINQTVDRFARNGILEVGVIQANHELTDPHQPVQVCSVQTLTRRKIPEADLVVVDECFSAGTMVLTPEGEKPIETFLPGDKILCATGEGYVVSVSSKMSKTMTLRFSNGRSVKVTPEHPFFTGRGWVKAQDLGVGQDVFSEKGLRSLWERDGTKDIPKWPARSRAYLEQTGILLDLLCQEARQPDEQQCGSDEDAGHVIADKARSYFSRREWESASIASIGASSCFGRRLARRGGNSDKNGERFGLSDMLQVGHSQRGDEVGFGDRRQMPRWTTKDFGSEEDRLLGDIRLESITSDERSSDEPVFNLHVAGHPSYFAEGVLVHNCHVMFKLYDTWTTDPKWANVPFVGLSATPWQKGMGRIWDDLIVSVTTQELIDQGHLSDFRVFAPSHPDLTGVKTVMGDYETKGLGHAMDKADLVADIVTTWKQRAEGLPTLCFAVNRVHAKHIQKQFDEAGVKTGYVDAYSTREERSEVARGFENGDITVVCNVGVLTTGVDWDVRCVILARPTRSEILYVQIIGRGLRTAPGKKDCIILDHSDTTLRLGLVTDIKHDSLDDGRIKAASEERKERLPKECPKCAFVKPVKVHVCPSCGFKPEAVNKIETGSGELLEITRSKAPKPSMLDKIGFYSQLLRYSRDKGYSDGWAYYSYKDKFGVGPSVKPMPALYVEPSTESWIRSRNIRRAKAMEKSKR